MVGADGLGDVDRDRIWDCAGVINEVRGAWNWEIEARFSAMGGTRGLVTGRSSIAMQPQSCEPRGKAEW